MEPAGIGGNSDNSFRKLADFVHSLETTLRNIVRNIGVRRIMRSGQLLALLVVFFEARYVLNSSWNDAEPVVVGVLFVMLVMSELVRIGRIVSIGSLVWLGHISRFTALGWAGVGGIALIIDLLASDSLGSTGSSIMFWASGGISLAVSAYAFTIGMTRITVRRLRIGDADAQPTIRITLLSDLHLGEDVSISHIRSAVSTSNSLLPDIVLLLDDYVDHDGALAGELCNEIDKLGAKNRCLRGTGQSRYRCNGNATAC
jgi:hypothetical protein